MKKTFLQKLKEEYIGKAIYDRYKADIMNYNLDSLHKISFIGMIVGILLTILSLPGIHVLTLLPGYFSIALIFTIVYIGTKTVLKWRPQLVLPVYYCLIILLLLLSIVMGTFWGKDTNATTFVMMMVVLPLFIVDRPYRIHIISVMMSILFCGITSQVKTDPMRGLDIANGIVFCILSMVFSTQTISLKIKEIMNQDVLKQKFALENALRESEAASKAKSEFFSRMSHDMRTPMNGILGLARLSDEENDMAHLKENIVKIEESGKYLLDLINDTLDFQRIESGRMDLELQVVQCGPFFDNIVDTIRSSALEKQIDFRVHYENVDKNCFIRIDSVRMRQILFNLLSNAVKFTPPQGKVAMQYICTGRTGMTSHVVVKIIDTGIGMSEDYLRNSLYQPFSQEYSDVTTSYQSSGLGLSIAKKLVELMNGSISVESELGVGTTFTIQLDLERVEESVVSQNQSAGAKCQKQIFDILSGKHILLVEDNPLNAEIAEMLLEKAGCQVEVAENGKRAVELFETVCENRYDAILMDIRMPVMDGLEAAKAIRSMERGDAKTIPIIAVTANAYAEDIQRSIEAGMNEHLAKPIEPKKLYETLAFYLETGTEADSYSGSSV